MSGYDRRLVEHLMPAVWDTGAAYGIRNPQAPDADMPKGTVDKKAAGTLFAHLADIRQAWKTCELSLGERRALFLRYALDWPDDLIAARDGVTDRAVRYRLERGVGKIAAHLNGAEYVDGYDELRCAA
ncbi:sigma-70 region 4 domain-containing protein [Streptomyces sp. ET3-23]|uniref:sigma-70 region 4 domain-containing protein n=1 Tax=Streptomyces sp. ET3-23 TaxID=2885643 RepID=UPI001D0FFF49|nr:sigma-70 region 4 domain-containing protein [Streptomyces sp. ET3-23]MCC2278861.1 sigma-70 region 4 domain-containing protein [Streptomyces sp. ET3-23]